MSVCGIAMLHN